MGENDKYHVDIANQIGNTWTRDSVLGIKRREFKYSIKILSSQKKEIYNKFIKNNKERDKKKKREYKNKVAAVIYTYLLYQIIIDHKNILMNNTIHLCRDCKPLKLVNRYYQQIKARKNTFDELKSIKLKHKKKKGKSLAHKYVNDVYNKRIKEDKVLKNIDIEFICKIVEDIKIN